MSELVNNRESEAIAHLRAVMEGTRRLYTCPPKEGAPGHMHDRAGLWDGTSVPCEWCKTWAAARKFLEGQP